MALKRVFSLGLLLALGCTRAHPTRAIVDSGRAELPSPARPTGVLAVATLPHPTATAQALGRAIDTRIPVELSMALVLGVEVSVLSAIDASKPMTFTLTGPLDAPRWTVAFTPTSAARARSALSPRYRFVTVADLGDRLEPRGERGPSGESHRTPCALVAVPSEISARVVCAVNEETLASTGRWTAFKSATDTGTHADFLLSFDGDGLRAGALGAVLQRIRALREGLGAEASAARREHPGAPDMGDPEAAVGLLGDLAHEVEAAGEECSRGDLTVDLSGSEVIARLTVVFRADGRSSVVTDAASRVGFARGHPLAARLPPDAWLLTASRSAPEPRVSALRRVIEAELGVLGARVQTQAARADLDALVANTGDESAVALSRDAPEGTELTVMFSQTDGGEGARSSLARIAQSPWLRGARLGSPLRVTTGARGAVLLQLPRAGARATGPHPNEVSLAIGLRAGALVLVLGRHALGSLDAVELRAVDGSPRLMAGAEPRSLGGGLYFGRREAPGEPVRWGYGATRSGDQLRVDGELRLPNTALPLLRDLWSELSR